MRSRAARLTLSALVVLVLAAAAFFVLDTEQTIVSRRDGARRFEERVRAIDRALADVRAGQQAYVAAGQHAEAWIPKVATMSKEAARAVDDLRAAATTGDARSSLMEAAATIVEIARVDRRAVDYLKSDQDVMAADVVYSDASHTIGLAANQVDAARALEQQGTDVAEREARRLQAYAVGAAGLFSFGAVLLLTAIPTRRGESAQLEPVQQDTGQHDTRLLSTPEADLALAIEDDVPRHSAPTLKAASEICTELGRVNDQADLIRLLGRAALLMDASGIVVWMGSMTGGDLRAALAYGYPPQTVARMPAVSRQANNAAASAYRTERAANRSGATWSIGGRAGGAAPHARRLHRRVQRRNQRSGRNLGHDSGTRRPLRRPARLRPRPAGRHARRSAGRQNRVGLTASSRQSSVAGDCVQLSRPMLPIFFLQMRD